MKEPQQYILEGWDDICATANASLDSDCPLLDDEVLVEMHEFVGQLNLRIIDLSAKLDQAIDMLNCQKRMELLDLWAKEGMK